MPSVMARWPTGADRSQAEWLAANGWHEVPSADVDPAIADWALPEGMWPDQVRSRFDGAAGGRETTVQTWVIRRRLGRLPLVVKNRREVISVQAQPLHQPLILRPRAIVRPAEGSVWPGASEVQSRDVLIGGEPEGLRAALGLIGPLLDRVATSGVMLAAGADRVVLSAADDVSVEILAARLALAAEVADQLERTGLERTPD